MVVRPQQAAAERHLPERRPDLPAMSPSHHPGPPPDDSRQDANVSRFMHCSEAPMRSVDGPDRAFSRMLPLGYLDAPYRMPCCGCTFGIGVGHRVREVMARWVWMAGGLRCVWVCARR